MKIKTIIAVSTCMVLLLSITGVAQDEARRNRDNIFAEEPQAQDRAAKDELRDPESQRERRDLFALQQAQKPNRSHPNPLNSQSPNRMPSNFGAAYYPGRIQTTSQFAKTVYGPSYSTKLAKINQETASGIHTLVQKIKKSESDDEKQELKNEIQGLLDAQYDAYLDHHEEPLKQLEARLNKLRDEFEARKKAKTDLVKLRLDTVWYDAIGLGWPGNPDANGTANYFGPGYQNVPRFAPRPGTTQETQIRPAPNPNQKVPEVIPPPSPRRERLDDGFDEPPRPNQPNRPRPTGGR